MPLFSSLGLAAPLLDAVRDAGYEEPTPIQAQAIPPLLERRDVLGCAQTGTGKTAAFVLPLLHHLLQKQPSRNARPIRALILTPTRELAAQVGQSIKDYGRYTDIRHTVIVGGVKAGPQIRALRTGVDIVVATPGRLLDLQNQRYVDLSHIDLFVLDEADRMLDMGFIGDIRRVLALMPEVRQNLLFSATVPKSIATLAEGFLRRPVRVEITPSATTVERIEQAVCFVGAKEKKDALVQALDREDVDRAIIFTRTRYRADRLVRSLVNTNIQAAAIHGKKTQSAREKALKRFRQGKIRLLVATDIAARGIDVDGVSHVFIYDVPDDPEAYVHRVGRTGRAGRTGIALSFCSDEERPKLDDVLRTTGEPLPIVDRDGNSLGVTEMPGRRRGKKKRGGGGGRGGGRRRSNTSARGGGSRGPKKANRPKKSSGSKPSSGGASGNRDAASRKSETPRSKRKNSGGTGDKPRSRRSHQGGKKRHAASGDGTSAPRGAGGAHPPKTSFRRTK